MIGKSAFSWLISFNFPASTDLFFSIYSFAPVSDGCSFTRIWYCRRSTWTRIWNRKRDKGLKLFYAPFYGGAFIHVMVMRDYKLSIANFMDRFFIILSLSLSLFDSSSSMVKGRIREAVRASKSYSSTPRQLYVYIRYVYTDSRKHLSEVGFNESP